MEYIHNSTEEIHQNLVLDCEEIILAELWIIYCLSKFKTRKVSSGLKLSSK